MQPRAPRRPLSPILLRRVAASNINKKVIAAAAGFPDYSLFYNMLRSEKIVATALTVGRLLQVADLVGFPRDEVFLDEPPQPRLVKRADVAPNDAEAR